MKRFVSLIAVVTIVLSLSTPCLAVEPTSPIDSSITLGSAPIHSQVPTDPPKGAGEISLNDVQTWLNNHEEELTPMDESISPLSTTASWVYTYDTTYTFYYYGQELSYSCGAASVRMALKALSNLTLSESTIRSGCGTTSSGTYVSGMTDYMVDTQDDYAYDSKYSILSSLFHSNLYNAISAGAPPIVGIKTSTSDGWFYNTSGHFIVPYAIMSDKSRYALADPWGGYAGVVDWKWYTKYAADLWSAYTYTIGYTA